MFEFIRTHQRLMQFLLMLLIVPSFALVGISGYQSVGDDATTIAKVDGQPITQLQWEAAQRQQMDRYRQMLGERFDQKMFDTPEAKQDILDNLIAERAVGAEVARSHLNVSDASIKKVIMETPGLTLPDGSFDLERYKAILAAQNMTPDMYDARLRVDLAAQQLSGAIQGTAFAPKTVAKRLSDINDQEREVQELLMPAAEFLPQVKVTDEMVKAFYEKNSKFFAIPEQVKVEYVLFDSAAVSGQVAVADAEISAYYTQNTKRFTTEESRRVSHILIASKKDASAAEKAAAKAKAEAVLADVRKAPADFAKIAKAQSQDPASAELGGDLDVLEKGALPKAVEEAALKLKQGDISAVVSSEFGFHILTVTALKPSHVKALDEVKGEITADLTKQKAAKKYSELAEQFTNTIYEQSDSLKPVVDKLKLKVETVANLSRNPSPALGAAPFNNAKFLNAVFSDDVLKNKRNTEAIEVAPSTLIAGRVVEFKPASKRPLAEVDALIRQRVTQEEAVKLAKKAGESKLAALKAADDASAFRPARLVSRSKDEGINRLAMTQIMKADVSKLPVYVGVEVPGMGYGLYRIGKVQQAAQQDAARRQSEQEQIANILAQQEMVDYVEVLKHKAKVKMVKPLAAAAKQDGDAK
ncbi:SurA N-terminal domain-containing protein [Janthinobacterium fluminis]|uniref:Periplasmic chaperone PpiD n=1 Tax=Janthinobacterium fluminis TaxID=2987524 RepID=A0ABT5JVF1_9BURK|nr:SurA N-terminal domain-containing protein [Janthinobacterium fluminis]MDC8756725.1 SurA N-terminal domain-containing protein [Janthinobacterium fluminis]